MTPENFEPFPLILLQSSAKVLAIVLLYAPKTPFCPPRSQIYGLRSWVGGDTLDYPYPLVDRFCGPRDCLFRFYTPTRINLAALLSSFR